MARGFSLASGERQEVIAWLSGQRRYAHITAIRNDMLMPQCLCIEKLRSEDSVRRAFDKQDEAALTLWMDQQMHATGRAQFQQGVARRTRHAGQSKLKLVSMHARGWKIADLQERISKWLRDFRAGAEQLAQKDHWRVPAQDL